MRQRNLLSHLGVAPEVGEPLAEPNSEEGGKGAPPQVSLPPPKCVAARCSPTSGSPRRWESICGKMPSPPTCPPSVKAQPGPDAIFWSCHRGGRARDHARAPNFGVAPEVGELQIMHFLKRLVLRFRVFLYVYINIYIYINLSLSLSRLQGDSRCKRATPNDTS